MPQKRPFTEIGRDIQRIEAKSFFTGHKGVVIALRITENLTFLYPSLREKQFNLLKNVSYNIKKCLISIAPSVNGFSSPRRSLERTNRCLLPVGVAKENGKNACIS